MKARQRLVKRIVSVGPATLVAGFSGAVLGTGAAFGLMYWILQPFVGTKGFLDCLYFSVVTQTTLGFGDILPVESSGKILVMIQSLTGLCLFAFIPSIILLRVLYLHSDAMLIDRIVVFYPRERQFRFRYLNASAFTAVGIRVDIRFRLVIEDAALNTRNIFIQPQNRHLPNAESMVPYYLRTERAAETAPREVDPSLDYVLDFRPFYVRPGIDLSLSMAGVIGPGTLLQPEHFGYEDIVCGRFESMQPDRSKPIIWRNRHRHAPIGGESGGRAFCLDSCPFRSECQIISKVETARVPRPDGPQSGDED